jgi:hypothetical protein
LDGYEDVLSTMVGLVGVTLGRTPLPKVGVGAGNLAGRFVELGCVVWGWMSRRTWLSR